MKRTRLLILCLATVALMVTQAKLQAQDAKRPPLKGYFGYIPWREGTAKDAMAASIKAATIPLASFNVTASKNGRTYTDVIVGQNPFQTTHTATTVKTLLVPMVINIGGQVFSSTALNSCGGSLGHTDLANFQSSPILTPVTFDGGAGAGHAESQWR